jgi:hypothetical protein
MSITPDEYREAATAAKGKAEQLKALPSIDYGATLGILVSKAAVDYDTPRLIVAIAEALAKLMIGFTPDVCVHTLNTIHTVYLGYKKEYEEFAAAGSAADAVDKARGHDTDSTG